MAKSSRPKRETTQPSPSTRDAKKSHRAKRLHSSKRAKSKSAKGETLSVKITPTRQYKLLLDHFNENPGSSFSPRQLFKLLDWPQPAWDQGKAVLKELKEQGKISYSHGRYKLSISDLDIVEGLIRVLPRGFGFVQVEGRSFEGGEVFVPRGGINGAVDGDRVRVEVSASDKEDKGPVGKVIAVLHRGRETLAGIITGLIRGQGALLKTPALGDDKMAIVKKGMQKLKVGDRIVGRVDTWGDERNPTQVRFERMIGSIEDPLSDIPAACEEYEIRTEFSVKTLEEGKRLGTRVNPKDIEGRHDFRDEETITIDPASAKDFDDALSLVMDNEGHFHLAVHIADVTHYVKADGDLDKEAQLRSNSTYFPNFCVPMLPPSLADNLCSLKPGVNRLVVTVEMEFDKEGCLRSHEIYRSVIKSAKRFSYEEAFDVIQGKKKSPHAPLLERMVTLCRLLKQHRRERGSVEFALPEVFLKVDEKGEPVGTHLIEYDITHQMVEEFMLKANEVIAKHLTHRGKGLTYRVHDVPDPGEIEKFRQLAHAFGFALPKNPQPADIQALLDRAGETPFGHQLAIAFIRSMKLAIYSPDNIGHYGLSLEHYCHFTSPIRRYSDLVVHRVLLGEDIEPDTLDAIAKRCSDQERISARAEQSVMKLKKLRYLRSLSDGRPGRTFKAVITRVLPFGISFELTELMFEGFLHVSQLSDDYYNYFESEQTLIGRHSRRSFGQATPFEVAIQSVDLINGEVLWSLPL